MKIKTIFWIAIICSTIQVMPLVVSFFSPDFKLMLISDVMGDSPSTGAITMFDQFIVVVGSAAIGFIAVIFGALSFNDIETLRKISFLFFVYAGFWALPDVVSAIKGDPTAPLLVIILGLVQMGLFLYSAKKGTV